MARLPRLQVAITRVEREWIDWWAAETGRTPSAAAARLLTERIAEMRRDPALLAAYTRDARLARIPAEVEQDIAAAMGQEGVANVLRGAIAGASPAERQAACYLQTISGWLRRRMAGEAVEAPPRLAAQPSAAPAGADVGPALEAWGRARGHLVPATTAAGTLVESDKGQLSDTAMGLSQERDGQAPRRAVTYEW